MVSYLQNTNQLEVYNGSAWASIAPTSTQGLTLINSTSFSGVTSQSVNNVFTSAYKDYFVKSTHSGDSASFSTTIRLRASGADNTSSVYNSQEINASGSTTPTAFAGTTLTSFPATAGGRRHQNLTMTFFRPQTNTPTNYLLQQINYDNTFASSLISSFGGLHSNNYQADGFTIIFSANVTGSLEVYGYSA
jgi:hypothetical protein